MKRAQVNVQDDESAYINTSSVYDLEKSKVEGQQLSVDAAK